MSVPAASIDADEAEALLVEKASAPSLASLFRAGKEKGLLKPTTVYGESA